MIIFDALVLFAKQQAGEILRRWWETTQFGEEIELIITSPLTRCIQTSMIAFLPGDCYASNEINRNEPPMVCTEMVREAFGMHYPDKRREKSVLQKHWPMLKFDPAMTETDIAWSPTSRETVTQIHQRIAKFLESLTQRPETNIVVFTHGVWIEACLNAYCPETLDHGKRRVYNCDIFVGDCISEDGKFKALQNMRILK
jgi:broad specificity phosphatase PhoE